MHVPVPPEASYPADSGTNVWPDPTDVAQADLPGFNQHGSKDRPKRRGT